MGKSYKRYDNRHRINAYYKFLNGIRQFFRQKSKINSFDVAVFLRQFAVLVNAGIPIVRCCEVLGMSQEKISLRLLIFSIRRELLAGKSLFVCFKSYPYYFDALTCHLIQVAEHTGKLDWILTALAQHKERKLAFFRQIQSSLFYPSLVLLLACLVITFMLTIIIPRFQEMFAEHLHSLPAITRCIFYLSSLFRQYGLWFLFSLMIALTIASRSKNRLSHYAYQTIKRLPFLRLILQKALLTQFSRTLSLMIAAGLPILDALKLMCLMPLTNELESAINDAHDQVCSGLPLNQALSLHSVFPALMVQMIKMGEESGQLEQMLDKFADFFESETTRLLTSFSQLLDPLIMLGLGVLIGGLLIGMYLPIFKLGIIV